MNDEKSLYITLKDLEKALNNTSYILEATEKMKELTSSLKNLGKTLCGSLEMAVTVDENNLIKTVDVLGKSSPILYLDEIIQIQKRKNKKKRINKKWAKKYGYNVKYIPHKIKIIGHTVTKYGVEYEGRLLK